MPNFVLQAEGTSFRDGNDHGRIIVSGQETDGSYSLLEWTIAAGVKLEDRDPRDYGMHLHGACEETFFIRSGRLEFVVGDDVVDMTAGDFVRVPSNTPHGYQNVSGEPVEMLVGFYPAGFECLFLKYRTDQDATPKPGFVEEASRDFASKFGLPNP